MTTLYSKGKRGTKQWKMVASGSVTTVTFGTVGKTLQTRTKNHSSPSAACKYRKTMYKRKVSKGYTRNESDGYTKFITTHQTKATTKTKKATKIMIGANTRASNKFKKYLLKAIEDGDLGPRGKFLWERVHGFLSAWSVLYPKADISTDTMPRDDVYAYLTEELGLTKYSN